MSRGPFLKKSSSGVKVRWTDEAEPYAGGLKKVTYHHLYEGATHLLQYLGAAK